MRISKIYHQLQKFIKNAFNSLLKFTYYFIVISNYNSYVDHCAPLAQW